MSQWIKLRLLKAVTLPVWSTNVFLGNTAAPLLISPTSSFSPRFGDVLRLYEFDTASCWYSALMLCLLTIVLIFVITSRLAKLCTCYALNWLAKFSFWGAIRSCLARDSVKLDRDKFVGFFPSEKFFHWSPDCVASVFVKFPFVRGSKASSIYHDACVEVLFLKLTVDLAWILGVLMLWSPSFNLASVWLCWLDDCLSLYTGMRKKLPVMDAILPVWSHPFSGTCSHCGIWCKFWVMRDLDGVPAANALAFLRNFRRKAFLRPSFGSAV